MNFAEENAVLFRSLNAAKGRDRDRILEEIIKLNQGLAYKIARNRFYADRTKVFLCDDAVGLDDYESVALLELSNAALSFDVERQTVFNTWAVLKIRGALSEFSAGLGMIVPPCRDVQRQLWQYRTAVEKGVVQAYYSPKKAAHLQRHLDDWALRSGMVRLDAPVFAEQQRLKHEIVPEPMTTSSDSEFVEWLRGAAIAALEQCKRPERDKQIFRLCFGLDDSVDGSLTLAALSPQFGLTHQGVSLVVARVLKDVKKIVLREL